MGKVEHLKGLLDVVDLRGSDVRLDIGAILEGSRQPIPYPAICWDWSCVQAYAWKQPQHINVLELLAFNFVKIVTLEEGCMGPDFFMPWTAECALA